MYSQINLKTNDSPQKELKYGKKELTKARLKHANQIQTGVSMLSLTQPTVQI